MILPSREMRDPSPSSMTSSARPACSRFILTAEGVADLVANGAGDLADGLGARLEELVGLLGDLLGLGRVEGVLSLGSDVSGSLLGVLSSLLGLLLGLLGGRRVGTTTKGTSRTSNLGAEHGGRRS